jgi:hypothetical protein
MKVITNNNLAITYDRKETLRSSLNMALGFAAFPLFVRY